MQDVTNKNEEKKKREEYAQWVQEQEELDREEKAKLRQIKAKDAMRKVELAHKMEEQKMIDLEQKRIQKERQSELQMEQNMKKKIEKAKLYSIKRDKAKQVAADHQRQYMQSMKEKERERDFKDYISNNILIDKELTHNEKRNLNNEAWQLKQEAIKAKQELEFSQRLEKIEKKIE